MPTSGPESAGPGLARLPGAELKAIYRYPVKGLSGETLMRTTLRPGDTVPGDRVYAIENGGGRFDANAPRHLPKIHFLMLMRDERLATLQSTFEDSTHTLTVLRDGKQVARGSALNGDWPPAHRAILRRLHEDGAARAAQDRACGGPQLLRRGG